MSRTTTQPRQEPPLFDGGWPFAHLVRVFLALVPLLGLALLTFGPVPAHLLDLTTELSQNLANRLRLSDGAWPRRVHVEMAMNVLLPAVAVLIFRCALPAVRGRSILLMGVLASLLVETVQLVLPGRHPDVRDFGLNALGVLIGVSLGHLLVRRLRNATVPQ
jgi:hypothetical protein